MQPKERKRMAIPTTLLAGMAPDSTAVVVVRVQAVDVIAMDAGGRRVVLARVRARVATAHRYV